MKGAVIVAAVLVALSAGSSSAETPLAESLRLVTAQGQRYGLVADSHPAAVRVHAVFERIARGAGRRPGLALEVRVLDTPKVVLESLRGGTIVVSRGAVDLAGADDDALAFLLGHEIAHQAHNHHALLESLGVVGAGATRQGPVTEAVQRTYQALELDADRLGVLFAMLAGYRAGPAIPVLTTLIERSGTDVFHPQPRERAAAIREQVAGIAAHVELFHAGLWLLSVGRALEAARVLEHFVSIFPSREVLSAIGVAYHREALRYVPSPAFRHVLVVDAVTRATTATRGAPDPAHRALLGRARYYYTTAADADPRYAPAQNNLAALFLDLGERELALGHVNQALKLAPDLAAAYLNRGVVWALDAHWAKAEQDWITALKLDVGLRAATLNLAAASEARGQIEKAQQWRARVPAPGATARVEAVGGVMPGSPLSAITAWLSEPGSRDFDVPLGADRPGFRLLVLERRGVAVLARGGVVEAIGSMASGAAPTSTGILPGDPVSRVLAAYGAAPGVDAIQSLSLWTYPSSGLVVAVGGGRVHWAWTGRRSDR